MASSRATRLRDCPPILLKNPPARTLPSGWMARPMTVWFAFGLKAMSTEPFAFNRAIRLRVTVGPLFGARVVNSPPIRILPSGWTATARILPFAFGSKPSKGTGVAVVVGVGVAVAVAVSVTVAVGVG